ncbi:MULTISPECIES: hypothetical protein [unclassified Curtobacterium]|uniref:hypothetical protein n=1 Tax=unclassified Curtobacterium TaxID=257496 RepID=UPI000DA7A494|nr:MULTISPECIES: hypothetical protein [unclassified Curtobacterium]QZQ55560.1 hypothetical protein KZI27_01435 [Curtobacterium sp. TC1]WIE74144.1 hypothetical protein DEJ14_018720 [Curtobacterium sp. MCJR17_020]
MKYINYGGSIRVMTADTIADKVIRYAAALNRARLSDIVSVPTADLFGTTATVQLLLAPAIAIALEPAPDDELEPNDTALLSELDRRTAAVLSPDTDTNTHDFGR